MLNIRSATSGNPHLASDCEQCFGLCCVALPYGKSSDFAFDKPGGTPCTNLGQDYRCGIHDRLRQKGFKGCTVYDCFGAGQKLSQETYAGKDWRQHPELAAEMFDCLPVLKQIHEMLSYVREMLQLQDTRSIHAELQHAYEETEKLANLEPAAMLRLDLPAHRSVVNDLLLQASEMVRAKAYSDAGAGGHRSGSGKTKRKKLSGWDFLGAKLKGADLRGTSFRGAIMIAADLRNADMRRTDLIGADLRDADLSHADLRESIFLTQSQINSAKGSRETKLPTHLKHPEYWLKSS
ncbi:pentapeptide repeat-containing protein [Paenibacillus hubeiensis]|uniref:pentapeptide repeat-containing protein n=1 Tax=Paenibacillus hubeiensis TaxID=3077330 RepID=UPI0031BB0B18